MVSIFKTNVIKNTKEGKVLYGELRGLSTDTKPIEINDTKIGNGSDLLKQTHRNYSFMMKQAKNG